MAPDTDIVWDDEPKTGTDDIVWDDVPRETSPTPLSQFDRIKQGFVQLGRDVADLPGNLATGAQAIIGGGDYESDPSDTRRVIGVGEGFARRLASGLADLGPQAYQNSPVGIPERLINEYRASQGKSPIGVAAGEEIVNRNIGINDETMRYASPRAEFIGNVGADLAANLLPLGPIRGRTGALPERLARERATRDAAKTGQFGPEAEGAATAGDIIDSAALNTEPPKAPYERQPLETPPVEPVAAPERAVATESAVAASDTAPALDIPAGQAPVPRETGTVAAAPEVSPEARVEKPRTTYELPDLYHGSSKRFDEFQAGTEGSASDPGVFGRGFYTTADERLAKVYAGKSAEANVRRLRAELENPKVFDSPQDAIAWQGERGTDSPEAAARIRQKYEAAGHDGVVIKNNRGNVQEVVAFRPEQLRRAENAGTVRSVEGEVPARGQAEGGSRAVGSPDLQLPAPYRGALPERLRIERERRAATQPIREEVNARPVSQELSRAEPEMAPERAPSRNGAAADTGIVQAANARDARSGGGGGGEGRPPGGGPPLSGPANGGGGVAGRALRVPGRGRIPGNVTLDRPLHKAYQRVYESATDTLRKTPELKSLGDAINRYYEAASARHGEASKFLRKATTKATAKDHELFASYQRALQNDRKPLAKKLRKEASPEAGAMIDAWERFAEHSGSENQRLGVQVYDKDRGGYRPIGKVPGYFPRRIHERFRKAMRDPNKYREAWNEMVRILMDEKRIQYPDEAGKYLNDHFAEATSNDYFAALEKARKKPLPDRLYDYSWNTGLEYANRWADRLSQIEHLGQKLGPQGKDIFDVVMGRTTDEKTKAYIDAVRRIVYNERTPDAFVKAMANLNTLATGLQLANPVTSLRNLIGGLFQNVSTFGFTRALRSLSELRNLAKHIDDVHDLGILRHDYLDVIHDAELADVSDRLRGFTARVMQYGGSNLSESFNRLHGMLMARDFLRDFPKAGGAKARQYDAFLRRMDIDPAKIRQEAGSGKETERFLRNAVNEAQFSYNLSQTPAYINTPIGKFLFKYQKFGTQMTRYYARNIWRPLAEAIAAKDMPLLTRQLGVFTRYWTMATAAGAATLYAVDKLVGYQSNAPDYSEIAKAIVDNRKGDALLLLGKKAWVANLAVGALGFFGNYAQFAEDIADRQRAKNPLSPPGIAPLAAMGQFLMNMYDQKGNGVLRTLDEAVSQNLSSYRTGKRMVLGAIGAVTDTMYAANVESANRDYSFVKKMTRRYADDRNIQSKRRAPDSMSPTPLTPTNRDIRDALMTGDADRAHQIAADYLKTLPNRDELNAAVRSMRASVRLGQPSTVSVAPSAGERRDFLSWAKSHLQEAEYNRIRQLDDRYRAAAEKAGFLREEDTFATEERASKKRSTQAEPIRAGDVEDALNLED